MTGRRGGAPGSRVSSAVPVGSGLATAPAGTSTSTSAPASGAALALAALSPAAAKIARQRAIRDLVARTPIGSQQELVDALRARGMDVTQATVSRDVAELGLVKIARADRHVYVAAEDLAGGGAAPSDVLLRRLLADVPVRVGRSGLILVLTAPPGTASSIAQAIDQSSLTDQEGTLAGDNTLLVLFADEPRLERWLARFGALRPTPGPDGSPVETPDRDLIGAAAGSSAQSSPVRSQEVLR